MKLLPMFVVVIKFSRRECGCVGVRRQQEDELSEREERWWLEVTLQGGSGGSV